MIDSTTKLYGLLGNPVSGSRSPWIHNRVFETSRIQGAYLAFDVAEENLSQAVSGLRALGARGLNITIPYKTEIMAYLDSVDPEAAALGAVNTIFCDGDHWRGFNTDGPGLLAVLKRHVENLEDCRILVLGAGGAAKGICGTLLRGGIRHMGIWNRSPEKARQLLRTLQEMQIEGSDIMMVESEKRFDEFNLVINTTSVGMEPRTEETPVRISALHPKAVVCDIVYKPHKTRLIKDAQNEGHQVIHGIEMLIEQALLAQKLWNRLDEDSILQYRNILINEFEELHK